MPTDHPAQQLCRIDVAGYTETGRIVTRFFDHNDTEFEIPNQNVHNLNAYLAEEAEYILVPKWKAEQLKAKHDVEFEEVGDAE